MGIFDWRRRQDNHSLPPEALLAALIEGVQQQDHRRVGQLVNGNREAIREHFRGWTKAPADIRDDPAALQRYVNTLMFVAQVFQQLGDATLLESLAGRDRGLPQFPQELEKARQLIDRGQAAEAISILRAMLDSLRATRGNGVVGFRSRALGSLGIALSKTGERTEAIAVTREALELCREAGDEEGVQAYTTNLKALGTYEVPIGRGDDKAIVVFTDEQGRTLAPDDLHSAIGKIRWEIRSGTSPHPDASRLHKEGRAAGARGDYDTALDLFTRAAKIDPSWAYPIFDRAFTHLQKQDFERALADYRTVLDLSPQGFFIAREAIDMLTREAAGEFPPGLYAAFVMVEHFPEAQRRSVLEQTVEKFPSHAPAWDDYVNFIADPSERLVAIEKGLAAQPDPDTRGSLLVKKAFALSVLGQRERALDTVRPLAASVGESLSAHAAALIAIANITRQSNSQEAQERI